eukprot:Skav203850  [mRNA]  locus=scaffold3841:51741:53639:- [translate_table: standard]
MLRVTFSWQTSSAEKLGTDGSCEGREDSDDYVHVSSCTANCTVSAEWAPDGRHFLTAVLAPRMRVDNGLSVWHALSGSKVSSTPFEELFDVQWRPEPNKKHSDVTQEEIAQASKDRAQAKH